MFTYDIGKLTVEEYRELTELVEGVDPSAMLHIRVLVSYSDYQVEPVIEEFLQRKAMEKDDTS